jgi:hypothetical protein
MVLGPVEVQGLPLFYKVFNGFVSVFKDLLLGKDASRMFGQATRFLNRKCTLEQNENHNVLMVFGSKENPSFLPCHIMDKMFTVEIARQYNHWLNFFLDKKKKIVNYSALEIRRLCLQRRQQD